jgi:hypothetical protein
MLEAVALDEMIDAAASDGAWTTVAGTIQGKAMLALMSCRLDDVEELVARSEEIARARGFPEGVCWADYVRCEHALHAGRWDDAVAIGARAIEVAEVHAYHRVVARLWSALMPIAFARRDTELLERLRAWYMPRRDRLPPSPFAAMMVMALGARLADAGLVDRPSAGLGRCVGALSVEYRHPSWFTSAEALLDSCLHAGEAEFAADALDGLDRRLRHWSSPLARSSAALFRSRVAWHRGADFAAEARVALDEATAARAPWWQAQALRVLRRDAEAAEVERQLGITTDARHPAQA